MQPCRGLLSSFRVLVGWLPPVGASRSRAQALGHTGFRSWGDRLSCPKACGIFPDQGLNPSPLVRLEPRGKPCIHVACCHLSLLHKHKPLVGVTLAQSSCLSSTYSVSDCRKYCVSINSNSYYFISIVKKRKLRPIRVIPHA